MLEGLGLPEDIAAHFQVLDRVSGVSENSFAWASLAERRYEARSGRVAYLLQEIVKSFDRVAKIPSGHSHSYHRKLEADIRRHALRYILKLCIPWLHKQKRLREQFLPKEVRLRLFEVLARPDLYLDELMYHDPVCGDITHFLSRYYVWYMKGCKTQDMHNEFYTAVIQSGNVCLFNDRPPCTFLLRRENVRLHLEHQFDALCKWIDSQTPVGARGAAIARIQGEKVDWKSAIVRQYRITRQMLQIC